MIDNQTFEALCQHIAGMVRTEEEAEMLAKRLSRVNWSRYVYPHICAWCGDGYRGKPYLVPEYIYPICPVCDRRLARCLDAQLARARHAQLPATLTMAQWLITMEHFGWTCAYCQEKPGAIIEHFLPLALGGGTTVDNCVPSCYSCNAKKGPEHPERVTSIPREVLDYVHTRLVLLGEDGHSRNDA